MLHLSFRHLRVFGALMTSSTATEAAESLNVSQPAVSKVLSQLEEDLGIRLFERIKGRLYPTPEAHALYPEVEKVFGAMNAVERMTLNMRDSGPGRVSIAALPTMSNILLPEVISHYRNVMPNVRVSVQVLPSLSIVEKVMEGHVDIGLLGDSTDVPTLNAEDLLECQCILIMPRDHPLCACDKIGLADTLDYPLISYFQDSPFGYRIKRTFEKQGYPFEPAIEASASSTICSLVENGAGIAIVEPYLLYSEKGPDVIARHIDPPLIIRPRLLYPRYRPLSGAATRLVEMFKALIDEKATQYADIGRPKE
ncbi:LysR substrate-binding domain-containing protein [Ruegeria sp.]|uniref:LysR family transcriptional regulator n=1 Tax=Ruegeria sp. TaxID=1879320 RepID=UPI00260D3F52|nr:LysR substrate-binding domain-containing protein [Ruegeria sp.]